MERFLALFWDSRSEAANRRVAMLRQDLPHATRDWRMLSDAPGFCVLGVDTPGKPLLATLIGRADSPGVVIGPLFERGRETAGHARRLSPPTRDAILASNGAMLTRDYWGRYVAIWMDTTTGRAHLLRDPSAALPCFIRERDGVAIAGSWICDVARWGGRQPATDWRGVQSFLLNGAAIQRSTALEGVREVLAGEHVVWRAGQPLHRSWAWSAPTIAASPAKRSFGEAREALHATFAACLTAWSRISGRIMVRISGGLDSSVLAALLARVAPDPPLLMHFVSDGYEGFEDDLARQFARHAGLDLMEHAVATSGGMENILLAPLQPRPSRQIFGVAADQAIADLCASNSVNTVMAGHGGDAILLQRSLARRILADWLIAHGPRASLGQAAYQAAALLERPVVTLMREALTEIARSDRPSRHAAHDEDRRKQASLVARDATEAFGEELWRHPWLESRPRLPPCKADHVDAIGGLANYHALLETAYTRQAVNPYISQPLMEFSLATPAYALALGGVDRVLARAAFKDLLPASIHQRAGKGFINNRLLASVQRNARFVRQLVLDGELVRQPWLDRDSAERCLSDEMLMSGRSLPSVLNLIAAEAWIASWRPVP